jgi:hypothetical protein
MGRNRKQRRQPHGSAWHWKQTDCWYYTLPGTRKRTPLLDEKGQRIRGKENREAAELSLGRAKLAASTQSGDAPTNPEEWLVAKFKFRPFGSVVSTVRRGVCGSCRTDFAADRRRFVAARLAQPARLRHSMIWVSCFFASLLGKGSPRNLSRQLKRRSVVSMSANEGSAFLRYQGRSGNSR